MTDHSGARVVESLCGWPSYDDKQIGARLVSWLCCRRTVYATAPEKGCIACR